MNIEIEKFNIFLELKKTYKLYSEIGEKLNTKIDLNNSEYQGEALNNTLIFLLNLNFIKYRNNKYLKKKHFYSFNNFCTELINGMIYNFPKIISTIVTSQKHYDNLANKFYLYTNSIPSEYMGFVMLMEQLGEFSRIKEKLYFNNIDNYQKIINQQRKKITIENLKFRLEEQNKAGEIAEKFALKYENDKLKSLGINRQALLISNNDVSAGYDIASFFDYSAIPNKYIEVKSCDNTYTFYMSRNEIDVAKEKGNSYYLYLYNRNLETIFEIQNPYEVIIRNKNIDWIFETENIKIRKIEY